MVETIATLVSLANLLNGFETFSKQYRAYIADRKDAEIPEKSVDVREINNAIVVKALDRAVVGVSEGPTGEPDVSKELEITSADVELLNQQRRKLIQTLEQSMNRRFERWTELYKASSAANDPTAKAVIKVELDLIAGEMCRDYGKVVGYLKQIGKNVEDYYDHVQYICKEMVVIPPSLGSSGDKPQKNPIAVKPPEPNGGPRNVAIRAAVASTPAVGVGIAAIAGKDSVLMKELFEIASKNSTLIGLAGVIVIAGFVLLQILVTKNSFPALTQSVSSRTARLIIWLLFIFAVIVVVLVFLAKIINPGGGGGTDYTGRVTDSRTNRSIPRALVSIEEDQGVPQTQYTDDQGIFSVKLHNPQTIRIRVESPDYEVFVRRGQPSRTGVEDIALVPRTAVPAPSPSPSLGLTFSGNPTIEEVRSTIESAKHVSVQYEGKNCKNKLGRMTVKLNGAQLDGGNVKEILENARTRAGVQYFVKTIKEGDSYAIVCQ